MILFVLCGIMAKMNSTISIVSITLNLLLSKSKNAQTKTRRNAPMAIRVLFRCVAAVKSITFPIEKNKK